MGIDDVRMVLTHFDYAFDIHVDYAFDIHGPGGGLGSTTWIFEPRPDEGDGDAEMRGAVLDAIGLHRELLDGVFAGLLKGKRKQVLGERRGGCGSDDLTVASGYQYVGRMTCASRYLLGHGPPATRMRVSGFSSSTRMRVAAC